MTTEELAILLETTADNLWSASFREQYLFQIMSNPKVGDFVVEKSTTHMPKFNGTRFGKLVEIAQEEIQLSDEGRKDYLDNNEPIPKETVYYIELFDGRRFRWHNASFVVLPNFSWSLKKHQEEREGQGGPAI